METLKERIEITGSDKWNVEALYSSLESWQEELEKVCRPKNSPHWPELAQFRGKLGESAETLKNFFALSSEFERKLSKLYTWAHMRYDEHLAHEAHKSANVTINILYQDFGRELSWAEPEILALPNETIQAYLSDPVLADFRLVLERIVRLKPHTLSSDKEELLALAGVALGTPAKAFGAFNNADLKFPPAKNKEGKEREVTHAKYSLYLKEKDRELRKNAFASMHGAFEGFENTVCEMINGQVQNHFFSMRARNYDSCLHAALFPSEIDIDVYTNLVQTVRANLSVLHNYMAGRKKALKVDELHMYDLHVSLVEKVDLNYSYETAEQMVVDSVAPLGIEYQGILRDGLLEERWVDRYENKRKRSGAYSSGCFDSMPYILMNFQGTFRDLMTLAHEAGHSMHSYMSHKHQPYQYSHYPIFLAEVASTFNEQLMFQMLISSNISKEERAYLINQKIEDVRATFFRQTMFAEFELLIHKLAEENIPLTPGLLKEEYRKLNQDYFGDEVTLDAGIDIEWARIPHFYYNFYVYQYATGISAAHALFENVMNHGDKARDAYLHFLSSGCSNSPLDILEQAGVNMRDKQPIESTIHQFDRLVKELFTLL